MSSSCCSPLSHCRCQILLASCIDKQSQILEGYLLSSNLKFSLEFCLFLRFEILARRQVGSQARLSCLERYLFFISFGYRFSINFVLISHSRATCGYRILEQRGEHALSISLSPLMPCFILASFSSNVSGSLPPDKTFHVQLPVYPADKSGMASRISNGNIIQSAEHPWPDALTVTRI